MGTVNQKENKTTYSDNSMRHVVTFETATRFRENKKRNNMADNYVNILANMLLEIIALTRSKAGLFRRSIK